MPRKKAKRLVIDADTARAAGTAQATHPTAKNCHDFLLRMLTTTSHLLVMTPEIRDEWNKHQSKYARIWLSRMIAKRRFLFVQAEHYPDLCQRAEEAAQSDKQRYAIFKDFHLVEAALATDQRIVSLDQIMRGLLSRAVTEKGVKELQVIIWVNPDKPEEEAIAWLQNGAPYEKERCLGSQ